MTASFVWTDSFVSHIFVSSSFSLLYSIIGASMLFQFAISADVGCGSTCFDGLCFVNANGSDSCRCNDGFAPSLFYPNRCEQISPCNEDSLCQDVSYVTYFFDSLITADFSFCPKISAVVVLLLA